MSGRKGRRLCVHGWEGAWSVLRCSPYYERLRSQPTLINLRGGSIMRHVCVVHMLSMIFRCSSKVLAAFCHPLSLVKKLAKDSLPSSFAFSLKTLKQKPPWTSTSVQKRTQTMLSSSSEMWNHLTALGLGSFCRTLSWGVSMFGLICSVLVGAISRDRGWL